MTLDRELPSAPDAERAVIGAALIDARSVMGRVASRLSTEDFHSRRNRIFWKAVRAVFEEHGEANITLVAERLRADGDLDVVGGVSGISAMTDPIPDVAGVEHYLLPLHNATLRRSAIRFSSSAIDAAYEGQSSELQIALEKAAKLHAGSGGTAASTSLPLPVLLSTFLAETSALDATWLIDGLLSQGGLALLCAKPKVGKSTISRDMAQAIVTGRPFLSRNVVRGRVVILALEDHPVRLREELEASRLSGSEDLHIHVGPAPRDGIKWLDYIVATLKPALVIIDPLFKLVRVSDANSYAETSAIFEGLARIARGSGTALLLLHHSNKASDGSDGVLGSTSILGGVDTVMLMKRYEDGVRTLKTDHRYGEAMPETVIEMETETGRLSVGGSFDEARSSGVVNRIVAVLRRSMRPLSTAELRDAVGCDQNSLGRAIRQGVLNGAIRQTGLGRKGNPHRYEIEPMPYSSPLGEIQHRESERGTSTQ